MLGDSKWTSNFLVGSLSVALIMVIIVALLISSIAKDSSIPTSPVMPMNTIAPTNNSPMDTLSAAAFAKMHDYNFLACLRTLGDSMNDSRKLIEIKKECKTISAQDLRAVAEKLVYIRHDVYLTSEGYFDICTWNNFFSREDLDLLASPHFSKKVRLVATSAILANSQTDRVLLNTLENKKRTLSLRKKNATALGWHYEKYIDSIFQKIENDDSESNELREHIRNIRQENNAK